MIGTCPRIVIAAANSGAGKTSISLGLTRALVRKGLKVQAFKVGPDYLDPTWLSAASGRPCYNLDGWMGGRDYVQQLFGRVTQDADVAVIEGVMGLFDGAQGAGLAGSTAEIAQWLEAPVLLVVDAHGMAQSIAPLVAGFAGFADGVSVRGIVANRCGSDRHRTILTDALASAGLPAIVGAVPRMGFPELPSRHLGLVTADPICNCPTHLLENFAAAAERHLNLDELLQIARSAPSLSHPAPYTAESETSPRRPIRVAVARDEAFHFYYQDLFDELEQRGCQLTFFSPLRDSRLPEGIDALYLGGGYPEEHAATLCANERMLRSIRLFSQSRRPVYAECGGLIYLSQAITNRVGKRYPLLGILPTETRMLERRKHLGYVEVRLKEDTLWGQAGVCLRGHEFHYSELISDVTAMDEWAPAYDVKTRDAVLDSSQGLYQRQGRILTSYVHLHLASRPEALVNFIKICIQARHEGLQKSSPKETIV